METIPNFIKECGASLLLTDSSPLREVRDWKEEICNTVGDPVSIHDIDAHNIVPLWVSSEKLEYSARTIRGKINKLLPEYLIDFPKLGPPNRKWPTSNHLVVDWENLIAEVIRLVLNPIEWFEFNFSLFCVIQFESTVMSADQLDMIRKGAEVPELEWCEPGENAAREVLMGSKNEFLTKRLKNYSMTGISH